MAPGVDYRQLQAPAQVDTSLPDSGAAARAAALGQAFKEFEGVSADVYKQASTQAGALAGAASGATGHPDYKTGLARFTAYSKAFNNAATGAYVAQAEAAADDAAARLRVDANKDPAVFATLYAARRDAVLKEAPALARPELMRLYNTHLAAGQAAVAGEQAEELRQEHRKVYDQGVERDISRVARLQGSANPQDQLEASDQLTQLATKIHGGVNAGVYSVAEAQAKLINAHREITAQVFETQLDTELARMHQRSEAGDPNAAGDVVRLLDNFRAMHLANLANKDEPPVLSEGEFNQLFGVAKQKVMQERLQDQYMKSGAKTLEQQKEEAGARTITVAMANGASGPQLQRMVASMVASGDLHDTVGRAVLATIQHGQDAPPDNKAMFYAENNPARFDWKPDDIANLAGLNYMQKIELTQKIESQRQGWESHAEVKDARAVLNDRLKLPSGHNLELATDAEKKAASDAQVELTRQLKLLNPTERDAKAGQVAQNVAAEMQARSFEARAAAYARGKAYVESQYGPKGTSPDAVKYQQGIDAANKRMQEATAEATRLRKEIKQ